MAAIFSLQGHNFYRHKKNMTQDKKRKRRDENVEQQTQPGRENNILQHLNNWN